MSSHSIFTNIDIEVSKPAQRENCPNTGLFLVRIFLYSVRIQENTDQK